MHGSETLIPALKAALGAEELPLLRVGKALGCFAATDVEVARAAVEQGLLEVVRTEAKGKAVVEWVRLTPRGFECLKQHESPKAALEDAANLLAANADGLPTWAAELKGQIAALSQRLERFLHGQEETLRRMKERVEAACRRLDKDPLRPPPGLAPWRLDLLAGLENEPRPVAFSRLFVPLARRHPELTLAEFHAGLLDLQARRLVELLPASGPPEELAEPEFALPEGGSIFVAARLP